MLTSGAHQCTLRYYLRVSTFLHVFATQASTKYSSRSILTVNTGDLRSSENAQIFTLNRGRAQAIKPQFYKVSAIFLYTVPLLKGNRCACAWSLLNRNFESRFSDSGPIPVHDASLIAFTMFINDMDGPSAEPRFTLYGSNFSTCLFGMSASLPTLEYKIWIGPLLIHMGQINDNCPSSLTNLSKCLKSTAYKDNCLAYCEQFLYWFLGPEVPFPNSNCQPYETCTFAGAKSLAITNSYSFSAGIGGTGSDPFKVAFNLGSTYTYSTTSTTMQTFTQSRPSNATAYCGYWTFLPYYVT